MPEVRIEPIEITLDVPDGESMMSVARDAGYFWPNQCDMQCRCAGCFILVLEGEENLSEMGRAEREALVEQRGRAALDEPVRLACQAGVYGPVRVRKLGIRRA